MHFLSQLSQYERVPMILEEGSHCGGLMFGVGYAD